MRYTVRLAAQWLMLAGWVGAGPLAVADQTGDCLRVKGWETLPDIGRLCAYLAAADAVAACERRGYRLSESVPDAAAVSIQQYVLLCQHEYVIELRPGPEAGSSSGSLSVMTAILETGGELRGEYTRGRLLRLEREGAGWRESATERWTNYREADSGE
jgi:hypothetical protein